MDTVVAVQYKLRKMIGVPRDIFYTLIWPYIPEPPTAPSFSVMKRKYVEQYPDHYTSVIYGIERKRGCIGELNVIYDREHHLLCGFCDLPGKIRLPVPSYLNYDICKDCELLYQIEHSN